MNFYNLQYSLHRPSIVQCGPVFVPCGSASVPCGSVFVRCGSVSVVFAWLSVVLSSNSLLRKLPVFCNCDRAAATKLELCSLQDLPCTLAPLHCLHTSMLRLFSWLSHPSQRTNFELNPSSNELEQG